MSEVNDHSGGSKSGYKQAERDINKPWNPLTDAQIALTGVIDLHIHAGGGRIDEIGLAKLATKAGMKALVLKNWRSMSTDAARLTNEAISEWVAGREEDLEPVKVFGGIVLNKPVGLVNPDAVRCALLFGAKEIWFPTYSSAAHIVRKGEMDKKEAINQKDLSYLLRADRLIPEAKEIIHLSKEHNAIISVGHAFLEEIWAILEEAKSVDQRVVVDHPHMGSQNIGIDDQVKLAKAGAFLNHMAASFIGVWGGLDANVLADDIRKVGVEHCIMSTDLGQVENSNPVEALRAFIRQMEASGLSKSEIDLMTKTNPAMLLGL
jgi:hypothetical protein